MAAPARILPRLVARTSSKHDLRFRGTSVAKALQSHRAFSTTTRFSHPSAGTATQPEFPKLTTRTTAALPEFDLTNHTILVSGAARGLGLSMAEALLEAGAKVYALDRLPSDAQSPDFAKIQDRASRLLNTSLHYRQIDVRDAPALNKTIADIAEQDGRLDGLIAAAGIQQETPALEYTAEDALRMMDVNVVGAFMTAQAVAKQMVRLKAGGGGTMAFIASMSGTIANRDLHCAAYNASKAAVVQLARNLASEWGRHGIRVNTISPGYIVTQMVEDLFKTHPERREVWAGQNMLGRVSLPEDYRAAAVFLMGKGSRFMTATDLRIDGGHSAW
ncbi:uncharacterized protein HMPREF1541_06867 [Cyphellophora europaea CBS 101466]|uniref:Uncharacterized protein n=1 Tax=Cyphellophora europaea (strain CBS 101466) TaxID=1220924 RepID=W2RSV8_CYPE1|nr:uncharacterized protein HMPREF1541_06867 [Cyphellophora europaea CBS 101466]ETN38828.1 hypothetical protein HMPREF1541_06867 [Cyphellophora europaea CBS 101466]